MTYEIKPNEQYKSLEIYFTEKPEEATRDALKALRFRWNPKKSCWYGFADLATLSEALESTTGKKPEDTAVLIPEASFVDGGGLYDGWEGGNYSHWNTTKELKEQLKAAFKKCGFKITIREKGNCYYTSLTFTWTISKSKDIETFENFRNKYKYSHNVYNDPINYKDEDGNTQYIYYDKYYQLQCNAPEEAEKIMYGHQLYEYHSQIKNGAGYKHGGLEVLTEDAEKRRQLLFEIVSSFNRDCSNSQIDYFDRSFYDHYDFKVVD